VERETCCCCAGMRLLSCDFLDNLEQADVGRYDDFSLEASKTSIRYRYKNQDV
jgi:hypothetical protein